MSGNLVPVQRTDRLGRTQRRWVRSESPATARLGAPPPPAAVQYTGEAAVAEFAGILTEEWGVDPDNANGHAAGLRAMSETARLEAVSALDVAIDLAEAATVFHAVRRGDGLYLRVVCETMDFTGHVNRTMMQLLYNSPDSILTEWKPWQGIFRVAAGAFSRVRLHHYPDAAPFDDAVSSDEYAVLAEEFKAMLLLQWLGYPDAGQDATREMCAVLPDIEGSVGSVLAVAEGLRAWALKQQTALTPRLTAAEAAEVARTFPPGTAAAAYELARERGAFDAEVARAHLSATAPALKSGIL